jgi:hypothetical protein
MIRLETLTDELIRGLRDSQPVTAEFKFVYNDCVRALGVEPTTGGCLSAADSVEARRRVRDYLELRQLRSAAPTLNDTDRLLSRHLRVDVALAEITARRAGEGADAGARSCSMLANSAD